jgi:hypothetical protein
VTEREPLKVDFSALLEAQPAPNYKDEAQPWDAGLFLSFADTDYLVFRWLALGDCPRESTFNLHQAVEKYLKSILLSSETAPTGMRGHRLDRFAARAAALFPVLSDRTFLLFCKHLSPYQQWGHYPERIFKQTFMKPRWNVGYRDGISEMDLVVATLRETAIKAMGSRADSAYFLEGIVHRDDYWLIDQDEVVTATHLAMRSSLLEGNRFFTPDHLPTRAQRYQERRMYPLLPLPSEHPDFMARVGLEGRPI